MDWDIVNRELARMASSRSSGPHAENILRDIGAVAAGPVRSRADERTTRIRFYQTGSFAVGNRLLDPEQRSRAVRRGAHQLDHLRPPRLPGLRRGARRALRARRRDARHAGPADRRQRDRLPRGVLDPLPGDLVADRLDPLAVRQRAGRLDRHRRGAAAKGREDVRVVGQGGDGGTVDIGFACLSGMFERNDDVLYICYDNEAYMNTGVQRSGATPPAARTATTQAVGPEPGNVFGQGKSAPLIAMAHEIPYVATATVAELRDLEAKVQTAMEIRGARYLHVLVPCPLGWGTRLRRHDQDRPPGQGDRHLPRLRGARRRGHGVSRRSAAGCRSRTTCARRSASPTCSSRSSAPTSSPASRRAPTATSRASACSTSDDRAERA